MDSDKTVVACNKIWSAPNSPAPMGAGEFGVGVPSCTYPTLAGSHTARSEVYIFNTSVIHTLDVNHLRHTGDEYSKSVLTSQARRHMDR